MIRSICSQGVSVLLVEQKLTIAMRVSKRVYVMGHGQIVFEGTRTIAQCAGCASRLARGELKSTLQPDGPMVRLQASFSISSELIRSPRT